MEIQLRQWQKDAWYFFLKNPNCLMSVVTGAGKTVFGIYIIQELLKINPHMKFLVIGPKNVILEQTWMDDFRNFGFPINRVGLYNGFCHEFSQITLCSIQSSKKLLDSGIYERFDMVIFDEVHNYATKNYFEILNIPKPLKLGLSATIEREDKQHIKILNSFNNKVFRYDIEEGIKDGVINKFEFYHININPTDEFKEQYNKLTNTIQFIMKELNLGSLNKISKTKEEYATLWKYVNERKLLVNNYEQKSFEVIKIIRENPDSKILVFNQYNNVSKNLYWDLQDYSIDCDLMNSELSDSLQHKIFQDYEKGNLKVLLATTMVDEGYNLPKIDIAILMGQNSTDKQFIQRMGRVLRKKDILSKVFYITIKDTYEEANFLKKRERVKNIAEVYQEIKV